MFSGTQRTRLGLYGSVRAPYGSFAGRVESEVIPEAPAAAVGGGIGKRRKKYPRRLYAKGRIYLVKNAEEERKILEELAQAAEEQAKVAAALGDEVTARRALKLSRKIIERVESVDSRETDWLKQLQDEDDEILLLLFG